MISFFGPNSVFMLFRLFGSLTIGCVRDQQGQESLQADSDQSLEICQLGASQSERFRQHSCVCQHCCGFLSRLAPSSIPRGSAKSRSNWAPGTGIACSTILRASDSTRLRSEPVPRQSAVSSTESRSCSWTSCPQNFVESRSLRPC